MRVGIGDGRDAEAEELVLDVERDDAGIAAAVELDAARARQQVDAVLDLVGRQRVAHAHQCGDGAVEYLAGDVGGAVVGLHVLVHEGHAAADVLRELQLELAEAVVAQRGAEACDGGLRHACALGQFGHRQADHRGAVLGDVVRQSAFGGAQRVVDGKDSVAHGGGRISGGSGFLRCRDSTSVGAASCTKSCISGCQGLPVIRKIQQV
ncbi:hypothetical protein D9M72_482360 [compost metagenome]